MAKNTRASMLMINSKGKENYLYLVKESILVSGKMGKRMEKGSLNIKMGKFRKGFGIRIDLSRKILLPYDCNNLLIFW